MRRPARGITCAASIRGTTKCRGSPWLRHRDLPGAMAGHRKLALGRRARFHPGRQGALRSCHGGAAAAAPRSPGCRSCPSWRGRTSTGSCCASTRTRACGCNCLRWPVSRRAWCTWTPRSPAGSASHPSRTSGCCTPHLSGDRKLFAGSDSVEETWRVVSRPAAAGRRFSRPPVPARIVGAGRGGRTGPRLSALAAAVAGRGSLTPGTKPPERCLSRHQAALRPAAAAVLRRCGG